MIFSKPQAQRRQTLLIRPFPDEWLAYLPENVLLYRLASGPTMALLFSLTGTAWRT
jgi:hypothetical protein